METTWRVIAGLVVAAAIVALILFARGTPDHGVPMPSHPIGAVATAA
jgi:hypothetical protein